ILKLLARIPQRDYYQESVTQCLIRGLTLSSLRGNHLFAKDMLLRAISLFHSLSQEYNQKEDRRDQLNLSDLLVELLEKMALVIEHFKLSEHIPQLLECFREIMLMPDYLGYTRAFAPLIARLFRSLHKFGMRRTLDSLITQINCL